MKVRRPTARPSRSKTVVGCAALAALLAATGVYHAWDGAKAEGSIHDAETLLWKLNDKASQVQAVVHIHDSAHDLIQSLKQLELHPDADVRAQGAIALRKLRKLLSD